MDSNLGINSLLTYIAVLLAILVFIVILSLSFKRPVEEENRAYDYTIKTHNLKETPIGVSFFKKACK